MASRTIFTQLFRASYTHLDVAFAHQQGDTPKFSLEALIPKSGTHQLPQLNAPIQCSVEPIWQALREVIKEQWAVEIDDTWKHDLPRFSTEVCKESLGVQFPPNFKDGDKKLMKDKTTGAVLPGQFDENSKGFIRLNMNNFDPVGTVGPRGEDINPKTVYSGCWVRAQIEVSAYTNKSKSNIISINLLNVQMCYDDVNMGGSTVVQAASTAFAGMTIADTNIAAGTGQHGAMGAIAAPVAPVAAPVAPVAAPVAPVAPVAAPVAPVAAPVAPVAAPVAPVAAPVAPVAPVAAPVAPVAAPVAPVAAPVAPVAAPVAPVANLDPVILSEALVQAGHTYKSMTDSGWTDESLVQHGHATVNYLNQ